MVRNTDDPLLELARRCGVESEFVDALGVTRIASRDTLRRVLDALEIETGSNAAMRAELRRVRRPTSGRSVRSATAPRCFLPRGTRRGIYANLYTVRTPRDTGFGDFAALRELIDRAAIARLDYVAINPLHVLRSTQADASPYYPVSRRFKHPLYLDLEALVETNGATNDPRWIAAQPIRARLARAARLDYQAIAAACEPVIRAAHEAFVRNHLAAGTNRAERYRAYNAAEGRALLDFATYRVLDAEFGRRGRWGFSNWPSKYRDARSPAVAQFAKSHRAEVDRETWIQFEMNEQWLGLARHAKRSGLRTGLYTDLAIGAAPDSADVWAERADFVSGFSIGAPPDGYSKTGQVWGLPPQNPLRIAQSDGERFRELLRAVMRGAGAIRIDHAIGLVRQYWVPNGADGTEGVLVNMPFETLFGAIAAESRRARCVVVAEDLGTVPESLPALLSAYRLLSTRVLLFARREGGEFESPREYPRWAAASANTHDLVPLAGWIRGTELPILQDLGLIDRSARVRAKKGRRTEVAALRRMLVESGVLGKRVSREGAIVDAVHAALFASPCVFATAALDDLALETTPINVPTATYDRYPVWSRRMRALPALSSDQR